MKLYGFMARVRPVKKRLYIKLRPAILLCFRNSDGKANALAFVRKAFVGWQSLRMTLLPNMNAIHRIIFIDVGLDELFQRVVHKPWWDGLIRRAEEEGWLEEQIDRLMQIRNEFQFMTIDGRALGHYEEEDFPGNFV